MIEHQIKFSLPEGVALHRLILNDKGSWEAVCVYWASLDKHGVEIPTQFGYAFKQHTPGRAIEIAGQEARDKFLRIRNQRNSRPAPGAKLPPELAPSTKQEEELFRLLDL